MTRQEAKDIVKALRERYDLGMKYYLSLHRFGRDDFGFELLAQGEQLQIGDSHEYHCFFTTRNPERIERLLSIICKRRDIK